MSSTRNFKSPGVFASAATTTIPPTPIAGVSYRDAASGTDDTPNGWRYGTRVESQDFNQIMFLLTSMMGIMDAQGVLGWSNEVDYTGPCITFGSDNELYIKTSLASGPNNGGAKDPISNPAYWQSFSSRFGGSPGDVKTIAYLTPPSGWLKCNGAAVSRSTYAALFTAIGTQFGSGDGSTTFNVPDLRGEFVRGYDDGRGVDAGRVMGSGQRGTLVAADDVAVDGIGGVHMLVGTDVSDMGADVITGGSSLYPRVAPGQSNGISNWTVTHGVARPRNVALVYVIKT